MALLAFASDALATVTALPGSNFQHTTPGVLFPNPIAVQVTDAAGRPAAGATVRYSVRPMSAVSIVDTKGCYPDLGWNCTAEADENGVAILRALSGSMVGTWTSRVFASLGSLDLGFAELQLFVDAPATPASVSAVSGGGQRAVIGTPYAQPLVVRVTRDGSPVANARVFFLTDRNPSFYAPGPPQLNFGGGPLSAAEALTDADGYARTGTFSAGWGVGTGTVTAGISTRESTSFTFTNTSPRGDITLGFQDMWWKPDEPGWGVAVHQKDSRLFSLLFAYDDKGAPTWRVMDDGYWSAGVGSDFRTLVGEARGSPFSAYDVSQFAVSTVGSVSLSFAGEQAGHIGGGINVPWLPPGFGGMSKPLDRWDFSNGFTEPLHGVADIWWGGPSQAGWGISIFERPGLLFSMWFTYDDAGRNTWYVMPEGKWTSPSAFEGRIFSAKSSGWVEHYDASKFQLTDVGPFRLRFLGPNSAAFDYNVRGRTGTLTLERFDF